MTPAQAEAMDSVAHMSLSELKEFIQLLKQEVERKAKIIALRKVLNVEP